MRNILIIIKVHDINFFMKFVPNSKRDIKYYIKKAYFDNRGSDNMDYNLDSKDYNILVVQSYS